MNDAAKTESYNSHFYVPDQADIRRLQDIIQDTSGIALDGREAQELAIELIDLYECLARAHAEDKNDE